MASVYSAAPRRNFDGRSPPDDRGDCSAVVSARSAVCPSPRSPVSIDGRGDRNRDRSDVRRREPDMRSLSRAFSRAGRCWSPWRWSRPSAAPRTSRSRSWRTGTSTTTRAGASSTAASTTRPRSGSGRAIEEIRPYHEDGPTAAGPELRRPGPGPLSPGALRRRRAAGQVGAQRPRVAPEGESRRHLPEPVHPGADPHRAGPLRPGRALAEAGPRAAREGDRPEPRPDGGDRRRAGGRLRRAAEVPGRRAPLQAGHRHLRAVQPRREPRPGRLRRALCRDARADGPHGRGREAARAGQDDPGHRRDEDGAEQGHAAPARVQGAREYRRPGE